MEFSVVLVEGSINMKTQSAMTIIITRIDVLQDAIFFKELNILQCPLRKDLKQSRHPYLSGDCMET